MLSKNNTYLRQLKDSNKQNKFSFRKIGTVFASVAIASVFYFGGTTVASADTTTPVAAATDSADQSATTTQTVSFTPTTDNNSIDPAMLAESKAAVAGTDRESTPADPTLNISTTGVDGSLSPLQSMPTNTIKDVTAAYDHVDNLIAWYIHVENTEGAPKYQAMLFGNENQTVDSVYFGGKFATKAEANASGSQATINH